MPVHLLLPFLLALCHRAGWLQWINKEWATLTWWKSLIGVSAAPEARKQDCCSQHGEQQQPSDAATAGEGGVTPGAQPPSHSSDAVRRSARMRTPSKRSDSKPITGAG